MSLDLLVREILEVDGTKVEEVRTIGSFPDPRLDALESAASLASAAARRSCSRCSSTTSAPRFLAGLERARVGWRVRHHRR
ncbi:MAG: hypothetical protein U0W40_05910 [Acidimicrobiia bacterium]